MTNFMKFMGHIKFGLENTIKILLEWGLDSKHVGIGYLCLAFLGGVLGFSFSALMSLMCCFLAPMVSGMFNYLMFQLGCVGDTFFNKVECLGMTGSFLFCWKGSEVMMWGDLSNISATYLVMLLVVLVLGVVSLLGYRLGSKSVLGMKGTKSLLIKSTLSVLLFTLFCLVFFGGCYKHFQILMVVVLTISFLSIYLVMAQGGKESYVMGGLAVFKFFFDVSMMVVFAALWYTHSLSDLRLSETVSLFFFEHLSLIMFIMCGYSLYSVLGFWMTWSLEGSSLVSCYIHSCSLVFVGDFVVMVMTDFGCISGYKFILSCVGILLVCFLTYMTLFVGKNNVKSSLGYFSASTICYSLLFMLIGGSSVGLLGFCIASLLKIGVFMFVEKCKDKKIPWYGWVLFSLILVGACSGFHFYLFPSLMEKGEVYHLLVFKNGCSSLEGLFEFVLYFIPTVEVICLLIHLAKIHNSCHKSEGFKKSILKYNLVAVEVAYMFFNLFLLLELNLVLKIKFHNYFMVFYFVVFVYLFSVYYYCSDVIKGAETYLMGIVLGGVDTMICFKDSNKNEKYYGILSSFFNYRAFGVVKIKYLVFLVLVFLISSYMIFNYLYSNYSDSTFKVHYTYSMFGNKIMDKYSTLSENSKYLTSLSSCLGGSEFTSYCRNSLHLGYLGSLGAFKGYSYDPVIAGYESISNFHWVSATILGTVNFDNNVGGMWCLGGVFGLFFTKTQLVTFGYSVAKGNISYLYNNGLFSLGFGFIYNVWEVTEISKEFLMFWYKELWMKQYSKIRRKMFADGVSKHLEDKNSHIIQLMEEDFTSELGLIGMKSQPIKWLSIFVESAMYWMHKTLLAGFPWPNSHALATGDFSGGEYWYYASLSPHASKYECSGVPTPADGTFSGHFAFLFEIFLYFVEDQNEALGFDDGFENLGANISGAMEVLCDTLMFKRGDFVPTLTDPKRPQTILRETIHPTKTCFLDSKNSYSTFEEVPIVWGKDIKPPVDGRMFYCDGHTFFDMLLPTHFCTDEVKYDLFSKIFSLKYMEAVASVITTGDKFTNQMWSKRKYHGLLPWYNWKGDLFSMPSYIDMTNTSTSIICEGEGEIMDSRLSFNDDEPCNMWSFTDLAAMNLCPLDSSAWDILMTDEAVIGERFFVMDMLGSDPEKMEYPLVFPADCNELGQAVMHYVCRLSDCIDWASYKLGAIKDVNNNPFRSWKAEEQAWMDFLYEKELLYYFLKKEETMYLPQPISGGNLSDPSMFFFDNASIRKDLEEGSKEFMEEMDKMYTMGDDSMDEIESMIKEQTGKTVHIW